jgi:CrcB protein
VTVCRLAAVGLGGALGAAGRYLLSGWVAHLTRESPFPYGTLVVNLLGALVLGFFMGATTSGRMALSGNARAFLTIGVLGAFTATSRSGGSIPPHSNASLSSSTETPIRRTAKA